VRRAAFVYDDEVSQHVLREDHVMRPTRLRYTYELLDAYGAFRLSKPAPPRHATEEELRWFHTEEYVAAVRAISRGEARYRPERYNFSEQGDNPPYPGMYEAACLSTGGSLVAAELVADGKANVAFNVAGGLHHAAAGNASGFCIFNDPVIAIEYLRRRGLRVAYVDIDCHHGDGVQNAYYDTDEVLTLSMHESGRYLFPGTGEVEELGSGRGRGYSVNVPLAPYTHDDVFLWAFDQVAPPVLRAFNPDVLVTQLGIDTHFSDPITHLQLTVEGHGRAVEALGALAPKWVALGGGGYDMSAVARGWSLDYGIMMGAQWPDEIPLAYRERYGLARLRDGQAPPLSAEVRDFTERFAQDTVDRVKRLIFPVHGIA
jgi:acetoin utilization protein AcuC